MSSSSIITGLLILFPPHPVTISPATPPLPILDPQLRPKGITCEDPRCSHRPFCFLVAPALPDVLLLLLLASWLSLRSTPRQHVHGHYLEPIWSVHGSHTRLWILYGLHVGSGLLAGLAIPVIRGFTPGALC